MEPFEREYRADDVDNRVERADFVQMDLLDRNLVDGRFRFSKTMKQLFRATLRSRRQSRALDQLVDLGEAAMRVMMRDRGRRVRVVVLVFVIVGVLMLIMTVDVAVGILTVFFDDEFGRRHAGAQHARRRNIGALEREASERASQLFERQPGVEKRAQHHVARRTVETIEIQNPRHRRVS